MIMTSGERTTLFIKVKSWEKLIFYISAHTKTSLSLGFKHYRETVLLLVGGFLRVRPRLLSIRKRFARRRYG